jgi:hypothetical protein
MAEKFEKERFEILWKDGAYKVSIPNFDGGEVVLARLYDELRAKLEAAQRVLENIRINLEGDLDRLPAHILLYKLQMVKLRVRIGAEKKGGE